MDIYEISVLLCESSASTGAAGPALCGPNRARGLWLRERSDQWFSILDINGGESLPYLGWLAIVMQGEEAAS